ncbi:MAG: Gfo/Idh/MocA family oxidoreductase [Kiritimatiellia bacterium]|nr:Gfo/Idh/MocA family oxidoreductase [Kiritimatiellia bacterium]
MKRTLRVGVFGVGALGEHHARIYSELAGAELVGVFDAQPARAALIAERYHTRAFDSADELAAEIEAASVVVPTDLHREVAGRLLDRGLHLLVEKPLAARTSEAEELVALAQQRQAVLQVGHVERFNPVLRAFDSFRTPPKFIEAHRLAPYPAPRPGLPPRGTEVSVVLDLMIHDLEILLHLVRSPVCEIHAVGISVLSASEDIANVRIRFENGCVANVTASRISPERMRKIRVFFEEAYVSLDYMNQAGEMYVRTDSGIDCRIVPVEKEEPLRRELESFLACVEGRDRPRVGGEEAAEALRLAVEICRRIKAGPS